MDSETIAKIKSLIDASKTILIIQADNPDGDSLGSALALEQIFHDLGKEPILYCGVDIPSYLKYLPGSDRVVKELPNQFDISILVDCATITLLEQLERTGQLGSIKSRSLIVIDHHDTETNLPLEHLALIDAKAVSTSEVLHDLCMELGWPINLSAAELLVSSLMADSLGLTSEGTTAHSIGVLAALVEQGVSLAELEARRRLSMLKPREIVSYKGQLLQRIEYHNDNQLALVVIPWDEIEKYSPLYNPSMLALEELRLTEGVKISIALKTYPDGKITGKLRCNYGTQIADSLAGHFGGGGHSYAAGFKTNDWKLEELKAELVKQTHVLLDEKAA